MKLRTQLFLGYFLVLGLMTLVAVVTYQSVKSLSETSSKVSHTQKIIAEANRIEKLIIDMETGTRGFLITGSENFLEPYNSGVKNYDIALANLKEKVSENPAQLTQLEEVHTLVNKWQKDVALPVIAERRKVLEGANDKKMNQSSASMKSVQDFIKSGAGKNIMDSIRTKLKYFVLVEEKQLEKRLQQSMSTASQSLFIVIFGTLVAFAVGIISMLLITKRILTQVGGEPATIMNLAEKVAKGQLDFSETNGAQHTGILSSLEKIMESLQEISSQAHVVASGDYHASITPRSDKDTLGLAMQKMTRALRIADAKNERENWLKTGQNELNNKMTGEQNEATLAQNVITYLGEYLGAQIGALYLQKEENETDLKLVGSYAFSKDTEDKWIAPGQGLVGQAALGKKLISVSELPANYTRIASATGNAVPNNVIVFPFMYKGTLKGVLEIGAFKKFSDLEIELLKLTGENIATNFNSVQSSTKVLALLTESQCQSEELQLQQESLRQSNEDLETQSEKLRDNNKDLETQRIEIEKKNRDIEIKAEELALASKYKSEFLANMSHELRTPLNSMLLLSSLLIKNKQGNLSSDQIESIDVIHRGGVELLSLINEILDLSKVEAGMIELECASVPIATLVNNMKSNFRHLMEEKGLEFKTNVASNLPHSIFSDQKRLEQVLKNLMSNAIKFTQKGSVTVDFHIPTHKMDLRKLGLEPSETLAIAVTDTGIGIPTDKKKMIFEAFQQAEGGTARKYGGTGLGLSISRELANLLGGEVQLSSQLGQGSTFTLYTPFEVETSVKTWNPMQKESLRTPIKAQITESFAPVEKPKTFDPAKSNVNVPHDSVSHSELEKQDSMLILLIENDFSFLKILVDQYEKKGVRCLSTSNGEEGLSLVSEHLPDGIVLDLHIPEIDGWQVLYRLKENPKTRHIPVYLMSIEDQKNKAETRGALGFISKPVTQEQLDLAFKELLNYSHKKVKELLIIEDHGLTRTAIKSLLGDDGVRVLEAKNGKEGLQTLKSVGVDCAILDLSLPDISGFELLDELVQEKNLKVPPIIVYTGKELSRNEHQHLLKYADSIIIKGVDSEDRLLDEATLHLHRVIEKLPQDKQKAIHDLHEMVFQNKEILIVDDDMRNLFSLSRTLEEKGVQVLTAEDGQIALNVLKENPNLDMILMDIMMPGMDGYETMKEIRKQTQFKTLPIIAITAKAMKEDRRKCIAAGASDYLTKPVEEDTLLFMIRTWI